MKLRIFYSWQSTTEGKYNRYFILNCIEKAAKNLNKTPEFKEIEFLILEGVRGEPGSPAVASKIIDERIPSCDIFIADLSVVNQLDPWLKWILNKLHSKFKSFQSNNVINEYGVATNALGVEKIIGVLNSAYGSPHDNPDNIPFDLRHVRFPIEYNYSKIKANRAEAEKNLTTVLTTAIKETAIYALQNQKNRYNPLIVWSDWEKNISTSQKYFSNQKIQEITTIILDGIKKPKESIRLLGLSGLGKTRILLEIFRPDKLNQASVLLSGRVLYLNCNFFQNADYQATFTKLATEQEDRIVILDNCSAALYRQIVYYINRDDNKISLITLDSNPEEVEQDKINGVNYLVIKKEDLASVVNDILVADFSILGSENIEKIKEFAQGIPLMAVLLGESLKNGEKFLGKLDDKELLDKLLGARGRDPKNRTILKSCSMFNYFGFYDDMVPQMEFIAVNKNITSLNGDGPVIINDFNETCNYYLKREIFEKRGRFIAMRPFPLAMSLAIEWLETCTPPRLIALINDIAGLTEPARANLSEALAEQMKYLGYNDKAVLIIEKIIGPDSPFDNAEVLNTELGSRFFRSFVEVNPVAVSKNFTRIFSAMSTEQLLEIKEGRRNLVWVMEKICFDKRTFSDTVKILYAFAVAENERWANNATAQLLHLFNIILPGTEASLHDRWQIIEWGLSQPENKYYELAMRAMQAGLDYGHFGRMSGAEKQGSKKLRDYQPSSQDVRYYWSHILSKLSEIIKAENEYSLQASNFIANSIRSICNARLADVILPVVQEISGYKKNDWDEGLQGLKFAKKYEKNLLNGEQLIQINELIKLLTKSDFGTRYATVESSYHLDHEGSYSSGKVEEATVALADEFIQNELPWNEILPILYTNRQNYAYNFGRRVFALLHDNNDRVNEFIKSSLIVLKSLKMEQRNATVLAGFIAEVSDDLKKDFYNTLFKSEDLNYLLFPFIAMDYSGANFMDLLFKLIDDGKYGISSFRTFSYSNALRTLNQSKLENICSRFFNYGAEGAAIALSLLFNRGFNDEQAMQSLIPLFKKCIINLGVNENNKRLIDEYEWSKTLYTVLAQSDDPEFAKYINRQIIDSITWENSYHLDNEIQRIYQILLRKYFNSIWPDLSAALLSTDEKYIVFYGLKNILGSHIGGIGPSVGVLFEGDIDAIFRWCADNQLLAPSRLAELTPIFRDSINQNSKWHPVALRLINEFGSLDEVRQSLNANMGTYSWTGSSVPLLEAKRELFKEISSHQIKSIEAWAKANIAYLDRDIEREKNMDIERYL